MKLFSFKDKLKELREIKSCIQDHATDEARIKRKNSLTSQPVLIFTVPHASMMP